MSFPAYPQYKDSGVEWLGKVPQHWDVKRLRQSCRLLTEKTDRRSRAVALENIQSWTGRFQETETIYEGEGVAFERGDILFGKLRPYLAKALLADSQGEAVGDFYVMRPQGDLSGKFAVYQILSREFISLVDGATFGAKMPRASWDFVANVMLAVPPINEQQAIAAFLDHETAKIDALVEEQRRLIDLLKEKRQAVISHAVTKGLNPHAPMKDSAVEWLGEVPEHWEVSRLGNLYAEANEAGDDDLPVLSVSIHHGVSDKELDESEMDRKVSRSEDRTKYKRVSVGDLVYNMMRAWQGSFGTVQVEGMVSGAYVVARPKTALKTAFVEYLLRTPQAIEEMRRRSNGVTDFRLRLYWDEFRNVQIAVPPKDEVQSILEYLAEIEAKNAELVAACQKSISVLQERRAALISAAVTGKIDVRGLVQQPVELELA